MNSFSIAVTLGAMAGSAADPLFLALGGVVGWRARSFFWAAVGGLAVGVAIQILWLLMRPAWLNTPITDFLAIRLIDGVLIACIAHAIIRPFWHRRRAPVRGKVP